MRRHTFHYQMPVLQYVPQRKPQFYVIEATYKLYDNSLDETAKFIDEESCGACEAFVVGIPENASIECAYETIRLPRHQFLVFINGTLTKQEKAAIRLISEKYGEKDLVFTRSASMLSAFAYFMTDGGTFLPSTANFMVVVDGDREICFLEAQR